MQPTCVPLLDESNWVRQAQQGDAKSFTWIVEAYQRPVYNLCYRMLGEPEAAEEAAQETFLRVYQNLGHYDRERSFATWLLSIAAHYCIDRLRRMQFRAFSLDGGDSLEPFLADQTALDPEQETARKLESEQLHTLLKALEPLQRSILILRYWQNASETEIAAMMHLTIPAVKSRLFKARRVLAHLWSTQARNTTVDVTFVSV